MERPEIQSAHRKWVGGRSPAFTCPACGSNVHARTSEDMSPLVRQLNYRCYNDACLLRFNAHLSYVGTTAPSLLGNFPGEIPKLNLKDRTPPPDLRAG